MLEALARYLRQPATKNDVTLAGAVVCFAVIVMLTVVGCVLKALAP